MSQTQQEMIDIMHPSVVEVEFSDDAKRLWINVDGVCRLRACAIDTLAITRWPPDVRVILKAQKASS
jgi:hypothetical protein